MTIRNVHPLKWLPSGRRVVMLAAGEWWDAGSLPRKIGEQLLAAPGDSGGAVIEDASIGRLYWLVASGTGTLRKYPVIADVQVRGVDARLAVPGPRRGGERMQRTRLPGAAVSAHFERGAYVVDEVAARESPPVSCWTGRVQALLGDGWVRIILPHAVEVTTRIRDLRAATDDERAVYDAAAARYAETRPRR
ncbi:hypothetical protein [Streptomyces boncukensis]|uniref:Uncharacterized protein n=1 Tax=Streptomyces boncukensis TaxID=2711219 RepID=A0A6G4WXC5_9ACTN|nr:hypothetical protein [Streptomyces boncukensis]NGO69174.1 hypothetical protein [Streptomyces boncukensis]